MTVKALGMSCKQSLPNYKHLCDGKLFAVEEVQHWELRRNCCKYNKEEKQQQSTKTSLADQQGMAAEAWENNAQCFARGGGQGL